MTAYRLDMTSAPAAEPVSLAEARLFLRLDATDEDALVTSLIAASREAAEQFLRRNLITRVYAVTLAEQAPAVLELPLGPVRSIDAVTLTDREGGETALSSAVYTLNPAGCIAFDARPTAHRITITYTAGYGDDPEDVPASIRQGILIHVARMFDARGDGALPREAQALLSPYKALGV